MRTIKVAALFFLMALVVTVSAHAGGNPKKGKQIFLDQCRNCHVKGAEGGVMNPLSKTQMQWRRFFKRDRHRDMPEVWNRMSDEQLEDLWRYLHDGAADSDRPETCG